MSRNKTASRTGNPKMETSIANEKYTTATGYSNNLKWIFLTIILVFAALLYIQTSSYEYALDDAPAIQQNKYVKMGVNGIPDLLKTDYWKGFTEKPRGHQYRPISLVSFAIEVSLFGMNASAAHTVNVLLYCLSCGLMFFTLVLLLGKERIVPAFLATMLYAAHPVHTEVVSNIKSRDEILCFLFGLAAIYTAMKYYLQGRIAWLITAFVLLLLSIMSKETGIAFIIIIPVTAWFFGTLHKQRLVATTVSLFVAAAVYLAIRHVIVKDVPSLGVLEIDNTLMLAQSSGETLGTAFSILLRYLGLLIVPITLSYDYSYAQIPLVGLGDPKAALGLLIYVGLGIYALLTIRKKNIYSWCILFFLLSLAPVSNFFIKIGATMAERFLYIPSFAFCLAVVMLISKLFAHPKKLKFASPSGMLASYKLSLIIVSILCITLGLRTIARNPVWRNNSTLSQSGVLTSENSARTHFNYGLFLLEDRANKTDNETEKTALLVEAQGELERALAIFPGFYEVGKPLGEVYFKRKNYELALKQSDEFLSINPENIVVRNTKSAALINLKRYAEAQPLLEGILKEEPADTTALINMGRVMGYQLKFREAGSYFEKLIKLYPGKPTYYDLAGKVYQFAGDTAIGNAYIRQGEAIKNKN